MSNAKNMQAQSFITTDKLVTIPGYVPNPSEGKYYVVKTENVDIFKPFDPKKPKTAARALYVVGKIARSEETTEFVEKYGNRIIVVSKRFSKLSKKHQLMLIERACFEIAGVPDRFVPGMPDIEGSVTSLDRALAAELQLMEKYGYGKVKRLAIKEKKINLGFQKQAGRYLCKMAKKAKKTGKVTEPATAASTELKEPITFKNTEVSPVVPALG